MLEVIDPQGVHGAKVQAWSQCNVPSCAMPSYLALLTMVNSVPSNGNVTDTEYMLTVRENKILRDLKHLSHTA